MTDADVAQSAPEQLSSLSLVDLMERQQIATELLAQAKIGAAEIQSEIDRRFAASAKAAYQEAGKESGTLTMPLQGGLEAKADVSKKIEWDSEKLLAVAQTLPWDRVVQIFKIVFAVPEKIYGGLATAPELKAKIDTARTVKFGEPKITLQRAG